jgi:deferrochelatase/peroxidase EfeB
MGFKDGTDNLRAGQSGFDDSVWVRRSDGPSWMVNGSYLVVRRIRIHIEVWDRSALSDQEKTIGRTKLEGAPLGASHEHDAVNLKALGADAEPVIATDAHVRLANQAANGVHILRRGYSFTDGITADTGQLEAGLFFLAYMRDPRTQFIPLQQRLARSDALNEYIEHVGSAVFAIPPGVTDASSYIGEDLLG